MKLNKHINKSSRGIILGMVAKEGPSTDFVIFSRIVAILCFLATIFFAWKEMVFLTVAEKTDGVITGYVEKCDEDCTYAPIVVFNTINGETITFTNRISSSTNLSFAGNTKSLQRKTEVVRLLYNPNNPQDAKVDTFVNRWFFVLFFLIFSGGFWIFGNRRNN